MKDSIFKSKLMTEENFLEFSRPLKDLLHMLIATIKTAKANK